MTIVWATNDRVPGPPCPVCGTPGPHAVVLRTTGPDATLLRCDHCTALAFLDATPPDYAREEVDDISLQLYVEQNAGLFHMTRFLYQLDPVAHPVGSLLDAGCGFGLPVDAARRVLGWRAVGIDPSFHADRGRSLLGADLRRGYLTADTDLGEPYDLVLATEVIEHIPDLYPFLAVLRRWMTPGGVLMMTTPDAGSITPALAENMLIPMLTVGAHLVLFSARAMEHCLRRAGFAHISCTVDLPTLIVYASDRPIVLRADAAPAHAAGYAAYLHHLLDTTEPGAMLWNGAAGRLLELTGDAGPIEPLMALYARIAAVWRDRFGIDLLRLRLPPALDEKAFRIGGQPGNPALVNQLRAKAPFDLGFVLYWRMVLEQRLPTSTPESVISHARAAMTHAGQTDRALRDYGLSDFGLYGAAWKARLAILDAVVALAPELEASLLTSLATARPGAQTACVDPPRDVVIRRLAGPFNRLVHATAYDEATRLLPAMEDLDAVCGALAAQPAVLFHALFCVGVLHLNHVSGAASTVPQAAFARMRDEAMARLGGPGAAEANHYLTVAELHLTMVPMPLPTLAMAPIAALPGPAIRRKRRA